MTPTPSPFRPAGPEQSFRVGVVGRDGPEFSAEMRTGNWNLDPDGGSCAGALGVLVDDVLGSTVLVARPPDSWSVSTEITIDVVAPLPADGSTLTCTGRAVLVGAGGGLARGEVVDGDGRLVAIATQRQRFVPGDPSGVRAAPPPSPAPADDLDALGAIGAVLRPHDGGFGLDLAGSLRSANPAGNVHGGISLCASDLLAGAVLAAAGDPLATASVHIAYLRPMPIAGVTTFAAETVHRGRTFGVARVTGRSAAGKVCTVATVTRQAV